MLSNATAKTVWARKRLLAVIALVPIIAFIIGTFWVAKSQYRTLHVANKAYRLKVAQTAQSRALGLGNRTSMSNHEGMLFAYQTPVETCFWMKDMLFPIDIIWVNGAHEVVFLQQSISPKTYPKTFCTSTAAPYVIELDAGQAKLSNIRIGTRLSF